MKDSFLFAPFFTPLAFLPSNTRQKFWWKIAWTTRVWKSS